VPGPGKRVENKEKTKKAILKAALQLFSRKGFHGTTTKEISQKAKVAEGTLFNYFRTKEDLALYFLEQEIIGLIEWFRHEEKLQRAPLPEKLFAVVYHLFEQLSPYEEFIGTVYLRALQPDSKLSPLSLQSWDLKLRYLRFVGGILSQAEDEGEIPKLGDIGAYGFGVFHTAMVTYWLHDQSPGKENTLALLDRGLKVVTSVLKKGGWEW
jgi:AcrR family transcriptional regulator